MWSMLWCVSILCRGCYAEGQLGSQCRRNNLYGLIPTPPKKEEDPFLLAVGVKKNRRGRIVNLNGNSLQLLSEGMKTHCPKQGNRGGRGQPRGAEGCGSGAAWAVQATQFPSEGHLWATLREEAGPQQLVLEQRVTSSRWQPLGRWRWVIFPHWQQHAFLHLLRKFTRHDCWLW